MWHFFSIEHIGDFATWISMFLESLGSLVSGKCLYFSDIQIFFWHIEFDHLPWLDDTILPELISIESSTYLISELGELSAGEQYAIFLGLSHYG